METKKKITLLLILCILWTIFISICFLLPPSYVPKLNVIQLDKAVHFSFFFVLSVLFSLLFRLRTRKRFLLIIFLSTLVAFAYGGIIEVLQQNFFHRTGDIYDLLADVTGGFFGAITYPLFIKYLRL